MSVAQEKCINDHKRAFNLGISLFTLVRGSNVLIIQFSHAHYDGNYQETIVSNLRYHDRGQGDLAMPTEHGLYPRPVALRQASAAFQFWRKFLPQLGCNKATVQQEADRDSESSLAVVC